MDQGELIAKLETLVDRLDKVLADHEARLRTLESRQTKALGAILFILAVAPFVFKAL